MIVIKKNGKEEPFNFDKILSAVGKACEACGVPFGLDLKGALTEEFIVGRAPDCSGHISIDEIQEIVENTLMGQKYFDVARAYIKYRQGHDQARFIRERLDYMDRYSHGHENAATASETDANANVTMKNVANQEGEVYKTTNRIIQRQRMKEKLMETDPDVAKQYEEDLNSHIIYTHDEASTPVLKQYCMAVSLYPLMANGVGNIDGVTPSAPNDIQSFSGQITNLAFLLSSQCKGAVAFGEYFIALNYYVVKEFGPKWYDILDKPYTSEYALQQRTVKDAIIKAFKQFVWGVNQPAGNRSYQSPFTNISYYDSTYFHALFDAFRYPDGSAPEWKAVDTLQRMFMKWFNKIRLKQVLTFPVETLAMVHDGTDIKDKAYKDLCAEMYAEGHSFFTYISESADSLASCCFSGSTKVLWKSSTLGVKCTSLRELYEMNWEPGKKNLRIFHNGAWVKGKPIMLPNRKMYEVTTVNGKSVLMTDNHINVTYRGEVPTSSLTTDDFLLFNTVPLQAVPEDNEYLTYEQGFAIGAFLGDGSFGKRFGDGRIYEVNFSLNAEKVRNIYDILNTANEQICGASANSFAINTPHNNVYGVRVSSKELVAFIQKWTSWVEGTRSNTKRLNLDCLLQSYDFRKGILEGWYATDGGNSNRCYTTSSELKDCMEILITSLGYSSVITCSDRTDENLVIRGVEYSRNYPLWSVRWYEPSNKRTAKGIYKKKNNGTYFKIKSIKEVPYGDDVYCIEMKNQDDPYFTLPCGMIVHNCRLRNELAENTFSPTSGLTGVMTGSCNVITLNMNRIIQDFFAGFDHATVVKDDLWNDAITQLEFTMELEKILSRVYKYHIAYKLMLYDMEDAGMFSSSNGGYIHISKLYSTIGINGLNEAARFVGLEVSNNPAYISFLQTVLGTIKNENKENSIHDSKRPFLFNSEVVPAEGLGSKNYNWDKKDGYWVPDDENLYNSYFYNAHDNTSVLDKFILHGKQTYQFTDGGSALHCNLDAHLSKEQYLKLIDFAIKEGTSYFTFNIPNSKCEDCGHIVKAPIKKCPICGSEHITWYTRVIGYLRPISAFGADRQTEAAQRVYSNGKKEVEC